MRICRGVALLLAALSLAAGCRASGDRPGAVVMPEMMVSVPHDPYAALPEGLAVRALVPPPGVVPMSGAPPGYGPGPEEAERAGKELVSPVEGTPEAGRRGRVVYERTCAVCHGPRGEGDGPIIGRFPNPPSLLAERARTLPDGRLYHIVTYGQGIMPAHAPQVLPEDRWKVVSYLRELQRQGGAPPPGAAVANGTSPAADAGSERGAEP